MTPKHIFFYKYIFTHKKHWRPLFIPTLIPALAAISSWEYSNVIGGYFFLPVIMIMIMTMIKSKYFIVINHENDSGNSNNTFIHKHKCPKDISQMSFPSFHTPKGLHMSQRLIRHEKENDRLFWCFVCSTLVFGIGNASLTSPQSL